MKQTFDNDEFLKKYAIDANEKYASYFERSNLFAAFLNRNEKIKTLLKHIKEILKLFGENFIQKFSNIIISKNLGETLDNNFINQFQDKLMNEIKTEYNANFGNANIDAIIDKISSPKELITTAQDIFNTSLSRTFKYTSLMDEKQRNALENIKEDFLKENGEFRQQQEDIAKQYLEDEQLWKTLTNTIDEILESKGIEEKLKQNEEQLDVNG